MKTLANERDITQGNLFKQQIQFFVPIFFGYLFQQLYTTADAVIVGQIIGKEGLAAVDATSSLIRLFVNLFIGLSMGATLIISQQIGAKQEDEISDTLHTAVVLALIGGVILTFLGLAFAPLGVRLMQVPADIAEYSTQYVRAYCLGMLPSMVYNMCAGVMRASGNSRTPLIFLIVGGAVNVALDLVFVAGFRWGVAGAAFATAISQAVSMVLAVLALMRGRGATRLYLNKLRMTLSAAKRIIAKGLPVGIQSAMYPISIIVLHAAVNRFGTDMIAAWAVCGKLDTVIWLIMDALAITTTTFTAQNYGAGNLDRVKASVRGCMRFGMILIVPISLILAIWSGPMSRLFVREVEVMELCGMIMRYYSPFFIAFLGGEVLGSAIRGTGDTLRPMLITTTCTCLLRIIWTLFLVPEGGSVFWIIAAYPLTWIITSSMFAIVYFQHMKRLTAKALIARAAS